MPNSRMNISDMYDDHELVTLLMVDQTVKRDHQAVVLGANTSGVSIFVDPETGEELFLEFYNSKLTLRHYDHSDDSNPVIVWEKEVSPAPERDHWASDPDYPVEDWQYEVMNGDTRLGYHEWVENQRRESEE